MKTPEDLGKTIEQANRVVLVTHVHPDGDALGSLLGLAKILESVDKEVFCYLQDDVPFIYRFLPGHDRTNTSLEELQSFVGDGQGCILICLDCGDSDRIGDNKEVLQQIEPFLVIDHHRSHKPFGNFRWVDPERSSTGEMVYELSCYLKARISYVCAYCLFVAISTDTGSFRYDSTTSRTFEVAADLVATGVRPDEVARHIYDNYSLERIRLLEMVLGTMKMFSSNQLACIYVTPEMFMKSGALPEDVEGFIDYPRSIGSVKIAAFIKQSSQGIVTVSLRAKGDYDVAQIARSFGGGGHRNAAGFRFSESTVEEVEQTVLAALKKVLQ